MILSFRIDRSRQTVQTQIRLLLEEQSDHGLHCLQFPRIFCMHYFKENPSCSAFRVITTNFWVFEILGFLQYVLSVWDYFGKSDTDS